MHVKLKGLITTRNAFEIFRIKDSYPWLFISVFFLFPANANVLYRACAHLQGHIGMILV